jgi:hypothetical protein
MMAWRWNTTVETCRYITHDKVLWRYETILVIRYTTWVLHYKQIMKFLITQFSPTACCFSLLGPSILLSTLFSHALNLCSSLLDQIFTSARCLRYPHCVFSSCFLKKRKLRNSKRNGVWIRGRTAVRTDTQLVNGVPKKEHLINSFY